MAPAVGDNGKGTLTACTSSVYCSNRSRYALNGHTPPTQAVMVHLASFSGLHVPFSSDKMSHESRPYDV